MLQEVTGTPCKQSSAARSRRGWATPPPREKNLKDSRTTGVHHIWKQLERQCKRHPWEPFTSDELKATMEKWKGFNSTGPHGVAQEALKAMNQHEPGEHVRSTGQSAAEDERVHYNPVPEWEMPPATELHSTHYLVQLPAQMAVTTATGQGSHPGTGGTGRGSVAKCRTTTPTNRAYPSHP